MVLANSSTAFLFIITQSNQLVDVIWFGRCFDSREIMLRSFPFQSQEGSKGLLS